MRTRAVCLLAVLSLIGVFAQAPVVSGSEPRARRSVAGVWFGFPDRDVHFTRAEMRRAVPARFTPDAATLRRLSAVENASGTQISIAGGRPSSSSPVESTDSSVDGSDYEFQSHIPYTRTEITDPTVYPFVTHVRVFSVIDSAQGILSVCSGTIIPAENASIVSTAAHCILDPDSGAIPDSISVAPGYGLNNAPFGMWEASGAVVTQQWADSVLAGNADPRFDVGFLTIEPDGTGTAIGEAFGYRGISFNRSQTQLFDSFGYPTAAPFDGERLYTCDSDVSEPFIPAGTPYPLAMGCDMTPGSSGGGWVVEDEFVNSVVSFSLLSHPEVQFGPYFGPVAQNLWSSVSGGSGGEAVVHDMAISLRLRRHLVAKGRVTSPDGYLPCTRNAAVGVFRRTSSGFRFINDTATANNGKFSVRVPDRTGRYVAFSPEGEVDDLNLCGESTSSVKRHRH